MFRNSKIYSLHPCRDKLFINLGIIINMLSLFVKIIYFGVTNWKLCVSTSGARMKHNVHGSLLTNAHLCEQTHSATARHEHAAQRNANGHRVKLEVTNPVEARFLHHSSLPYHESLPYDI